MLHPHPYTIMTMPRILSTVLLVSVLAFTPFSSHAQLGVAAGLNFASIDDIDVAGGRGNFDSATGYHIGAFYDLGLGPAGLRLGLFYRDMGDVDVSLAGLRESFDVSMIDIPVDFRFNVLATPVIRPYILAGPVFSFASTDNDDFDDALTDVQVGGNVGLGLSVNIGVARLFPELRYSVGLSRFLEDDAAVRGVRFTADDTQRQNSVMLRLGILF